MFSRSVMSDSLWLHGLQHTRLPCCSPSPGACSNSCPLSRWSEVAQSCPTLCDSMDCSLPGCSVHGIFQARIQEWVAIYFSRRCSRPRNWTGVSHTVGRPTVWATREVGDAIQASHRLFPPFSCPQSLPTSGSFPVSQLFPSGGQSTGTSASASVLPQISRVGSL